MSINNDKCECFACNIPSLETIKISNHNSSFDKESFFVLNCLKDKLDFKQNGEENVEFHIKKNAIIEKPLQIINFLDGKKPQQKSKIKLIMGENSSLTVFFCDDSDIKSEDIVEHEIEIQMNNYSKLAFYKMENVNNHTTISSKITYNLAQNSQLNGFFITLNGGKLSNNICVNFNDTHSIADLNGLYLMDKEQSVFTSVDVFHYKNDCKSMQLFKGILDDEAKADFLGHIFIDYNARNNEAHQTNNNILLTDKAKINTHPILEIYNDDVQCSHGATTGRLDEQALYYLRTRGIGEKTAKMLLMKAFCQNILQKSDIKELQEGLSKMIESRLDGNLSYNNPFKIDI